MKIIATADLHFDEHSRWQECLRVVCENFVAIVQREMPDVVLIAGDIYERASTPRERKAVAAFLTIVSNICPVVITRGNHDREKDLDILAMLRGIHPITVVNGAEVVYVAGAAIAAMAWPDESAVLASSLSGPGDAADADTLARDALRNVMAALGDELSRHKGPRIAMGHFMVDGSVTSVGQPLLGHPMNVGLADLALFRASLGVMGHIHKAQEFDVAGARFFYTGSQFRTDFGQTEQKTILLAEFNGAELVRVEQLDTGATPMVHLDGEWSNAERAIVAEFDETLVTGAEVRFRYRVPRDQRLQARTSAQKYRAELLACGAVAVKVEEDPYVVKRADAPKVSRVRSIAEKLPLHWESIGFDPGARRAALVRKAVKLEEAAGANPLAPTWVRLNSWRCKGFGPHRGEFSFDLTKFPYGSIIGFDGPNGSGKSFSLEAAVAGTCYREMPNHGQLVHRARDRDSFSEGSVTAGDRTWTIRHEVDATSGKAKSLVLGEDGSPAYASTKVKDFDAWAPKYLPHPDVLFATQVAAQPGKRPKRRFIDLLSSERISAALRVIGVERIEQMAAGARAALADAEKAFLVAQQRLDDEIERAGDLESAEASVRDAELGLEGAAVALKAARETVRLAEAEEASVAAKNAARAQQRARRDEIVSQRDAAATKRDALASRVNALAMASKVSPADEELASFLEDARMSLARAEADAVRIAEIVARNDAYCLARAKAQEALEAERAKLAELAVRQERTSLLCATGTDIRRAAAAIEEAKARVAEADREIAANDARCLDLKREEQRILKTIDALEATVVQLRSRVARGDELRAAETALPALRAEVERLRAAAVSSEQALDAIRGQRLAGAEERIAGLRSGLTDIAVGKAESPRDRASNELARDDELVMLSDTFQARIDSAKREFEKATAALEAAKGAVQAAERLAALVPGLAVDEAEFEKAAADLETAQSSHAPVLAEINAVCAKMIELRYAQIAAGNDVARLAPLAGQLSELERAEAVLSEVERQTGEARARLADLEEKVSAPLALEEVPTTEGLEDLRATVARATEAAARIAGAQRSRDLLVEVEAQHIQATAEAARLDVALVEFADVAEDAVPTLDAMAARSAASGAEELEREAVATLATAKARRDTVVAQRARVPELRKARDEAAADVADWKRLSLDLGRDGIQSAEIAGMGPDLTEITNELLRECHGPRFTVSVETSRPSADGKKQIDEFLIYVTDSETGDPERDASEFSGGERVILGEAVENALLILGCIKTDARHPTIVRDESMPALDAANMRAYPRMLRHVIEKTQAAHLLLVTHSDELKELCDFRIDVRTSDSVVQCDALEAAAE